MDRTILHADVNNFYASVAIRNNPSLKDKPIVICGDPDKRHGIVLAKSNPAKKLGIKTGDTIGAAKKLCPELICLPPYYKEYTAVSKQIFDIYKRFTPLVESFGLDECWLDVTGSIGLFGDGETIANLIRETVKKEIGVTISVGVSFTKVFAKLGSDLKKPDAVSVISKDNYKTVAWRLPVSDMLYIGRKVQQKLASYEINTIGDLARCNKDFLISKFGKVGEKMHDYANGTDNEDVGVYYAMHIPESISNGTTAQEDIVNERNAASMIYSLSEVIAFRLRKHKLLAMGVGIYVRNSEFTMFSKQQKLEEATSDARVIGKTAYDMLVKNCCISEGNPIRLITIGTYNLVDEDRIYQQSIFNDSAQKYLEVNKKLDKIRKKYGYGVLKKAIELDDTFVCDTKEVDDGFLPFDKTRPENADK